MLTEPVTIPLTDHHRAQFARWDLEAKAVQQRVSLAVEVLMATVIDPATMPKVDYAVTDAGLVLTPKE